MKMVSTGLIAILLERINLRNKISTTRNIIFHPQPPIQSGSAVFYIYIKLIKYLSLSCNESNQFFSTILFNFDGTIFLKNCSPLVKIGFFIFTRKFEQASFYNYILVIVTIIRTYQQELQSRPQIDSIISEKIVEQNLSRLFILKEQLQFIQLLSFIHSFKINLNLFKRVYLLLSSPGADICIQVCDLLFFVRLTQCQNNFGDTGFTSFKSYEILCAEVQM